MRQIALCGADCERRGRRVRPGLVERIIRQLPDHRARVCTSCARSAVSIGGESGNCGRRRRAGRDRSGASCSGNGGRARIGQRIARGRRGYGRSAHTEVSRKFHRDGTASANLRRTHFVREVCRACIGRSKNACAGRFRQTCSGGGDADSRFGRNCYRNRGRSGGGKLPVPLRGSSDEYRCCHC